METLRAIPLDTILLVLARVTVVALTGRLLLAALARRAASTRYLVAVATFCSMLAVPLISAAGVQWRLAWLPAQKTAELAKLDADVPGGAQFLAPSATAPATLFESWRGWLLPATLAVAAIFVGRMLFGMIAIRWITHRARDVADDSVVRDFDAAAGRMGIARMVRLLASDRVAVPLVWGVRSPALLLPAAALQWSRERLRVVFEHELAHLRRGDAMTLLLTRAVAALYWFHPLVWSLDRAARRDCEQACDDLVLATGTRASDYADHLLGIARSLPPRDPFGAVTLAMSRRSQLEGRLLSILQPDARRGGVSRRAGAAATVIAALLVLPVATIRLTAHPAPLEKHAEVHRASGDASAQSLYSAGKRSFNDHDYPAAIDSFTKAIQIEPFAGSAWYNLACALALDGEHNRALDTLELALLHGYGGDGKEILKDRDLESLHGRRLDEIARLADDLVLKGDGENWRVMIPHYEQIVHEHPQIARAWFNYGFVLTEGGEPRASIDPYMHALDQDYRPGAVMYNLACAYALLGERDAAISWLMKASKAGFDVGGFAKEDRDLSTLRDEPWLAEKVAEARWKHDQETQKDK